MSLKKTTFAAMAAAMLLLTACHKPKTPVLEDVTDTFSWILGRNTAEGIKAGPFKDIDHDIFMRAIEATFNGDPQPIDDSTYHAALQQLTRVLQMQMQRETSDRQTIVDQKQEEYFKNLTAENPNVKKHPSGFYYEVLKEGKGKKAFYAAHVYFDYRSFTMLDGKPYDQTYGKREPINHVIGDPMFKGLIEGMMLMNEGSIYRFYFPYQLAFGPQGSGDIPGYTPFIYEVELHSVSSL